VHHKTTNNITAAVPGSSTYASPLLPDTRSYALTTHQQPRWSSCQSSTGPIWKLGCRTRIL